MGNFLDILKEIESCRMAGFGRPALFEALMLPDICGETLVPENGDVEKKVKRKYIRWIQKYVSLTHPCVGQNEEGQLCEQESEKVEYLSLSAQEIYSLRNCLFHGGNVRCFKGKNPAPYVFDFSQIKQIYPCVIPQIHIYNYKVINVGMLICQLVNGAKKYYQEANDQRKNFLDAFDELVVYDDFCSEMASKMTSDYMNRRKYKCTERDK